MEDYIYILLGIVWVLYSLYRANKKSKEKQRVTENEDSYSESESVDQALKEIMLGLSGTPEPKVTSYEDDHRLVMEPEEPEPVVNKTKFKLDSIPAEEGSPVFNRIKSGFDREVDYNDDAQESENLRDYLDFDLRKAVIFSEILNRPYQ